MSIVLYINCTVSADGVVSMCDCVIVGCGLYLLNVT